MSQDHTGTIINSFPGYKYVPKGEIDANRHNMFRGVDVGFGGYIYSNPGMYYSVGLLDIQSMHPNSIIAMNYFGEYTQNYKDLLDARIFIKHGDFESAKNLMNGKLVPYLNDKNQADELAQALKIALNSTYGITAASFENALRDSRNINNIVALRGALFMKTLQDEVESRGYTVVSIRTDSIKIANIDENIISFVTDFAKPYGYIFEHEAVYEKMCLVDKTNYIAKYDSKGVRNKGGKHAGEWTATGATFQHPYIFKTLFSHEPIEFKDMCETKEVKGDYNIYLDMNEDLDDPTELEVQLEKIEKKFGPDHPSLIELRAQIADCHNYKFVGRVGSFCPMKPGTGGGWLVKTKGDKYAMVTGATGYRWLEAELVESIGKQDDIEIGYFRSLVDDAIEHIAEFGDAEAFISDDVPADDPSVLPWCDKDDCNSCADRKECHDLAASFVTNI